MSMGFGANFADVIEEEFLRKFCNTELDTFLSEVTKAELETFDIRELFEYEGYLDYTPNKGNRWYPVCKAYADLLKKFKKSTGLILTYCYHDSENGDIYDDVDGLFWIVDGVFTYTPSGKKHKNNITRKFWVTHG